MLRRTTISVFAILFLFGFIFFSCDNKEDVKIAKVFDEFLYLSQIKQDVNFSKLSQKDSLLIVKAYINEWVNKKISLQYAKKHIDNKDEISKKMQSIEDDLFIYEYERQYIINNLDTIVPENEIVDYYEKNKANFNLKENILKVLYVKFEADYNYKKENIQELLSSENIKDREKLTEIIKKDAVNSYLNDTVWLLFDDLLKEVPINTYNQTNFLKHNKYINIQNNDYQYHLYVKDFKIKDTESPLSYEYNKIKNIILNRRKKELIDDMKKSIRTAAYSDKEVKIYKIID